MERFQQAPSRMTLLPHTRRLYRLLWRYRPRIYVDPESYLPVSFYRDYLPSTVVRSSRGRVEFKHPDRGLLRRIKGSDRYYLDYEPSPERALDQSLDEVQPTLYARAYRDVLAADGHHIELLFLKYSPVFPYSGLAADTSWWKQLGSWLIGDPLGWHELDIHGAIHVILDAGSLRPLGVLLAQHNYHRVHWRTIDFAWPGNDRVPISFATYSNEPYLMQGDRAVRTERTVGNPVDLPYLFGRTDLAPLASGFDRIRTPRSGAVPVPFELRLLPPNDPLYTSEMPLGAKKRLYGLWESWYREGPPGMNYYTLPGLKNLADLTAFWDVDPGDDRFFEKFRARERSLHRFHLAPLLSLQQRKTSELLHRLLRTLQGQRSDASPRQRRR